MQLLTEELRAQLPALYAQEGVSDPIVYAKFFAPWTSWTWYITEGSDQEDDFFFFGYVIGLECEWGYSSLRELESIRGPGGLTIERDLSFTPKPKSEIKDIE
jgi:hypothetical protein